MSRVRKAENACFFNAYLPIFNKRKYGIDYDAIEMVRKRANTNYINTLITSKKESYYQSRFSVKYSSKTCKRKNSKL